MQQGETHDFTIHIPTNLGGLDISVGDGVGNANLSLIRVIETVSINSEGKEITKIEYEDIGHNNKSGPIQPGMSLAAGLYNITVHAISDISDVHLKVRYKAYDPGTGSETNSRIPSTGSLVPELSFNKWTQKFDQGEPLYFSVDVPDGQSWLYVFGNYSQGDMDLYVRGGEYPTASDYDCRSINPGFGENGGPIIEENIKVEKCILPVNSPGRYYIMLTPYNHRSYGQADVLAYYYSSSTSKTGASPSSESLSGQPEELLLTDDFNLGLSSQVNAVKWTRGTNAANNAHVSDNKLKLLVNDDRLESAWIRTSNAYTAKNTTVSVYIPQVNRDGELAMSPSYTSNAKYGFYEEPNTYRFFTGDSVGGSYTLNVSHTQDGQLDKFDVTNGMDISSGVYLRMRFDETHIHFEASLDGLTWVDKYNEPFSLPGNTLDSPFYYSLSAYKSWSNGQGNGVMMLDDFEIRSKISKNRGATSAPAISNIAVSKIKPGSATVNWDTDKTTTSYLFYWPKSAGKSSSQCSLKSIGKTSHNIDISELSPGTVYEYSVYAEDSSNNSIESNIMEFVTPLKILLEDNFNQGIYDYVDNTKWVQGTNYQNNAKISYDQLKLHTIDNIYQSAWVRTKNAYVAKNTTVSVHVTQVNRDGELAMSPTYTGDASFGFYEEPNTYRFFTGDPEGGPYTLNVSHTQNGVLNKFEVTKGMDVSSGVYLRIRLDDTRIYFEASLDGITWITNYDELFTLPGYTLDNHFYYSLSAYKPWSNGLGNDVMIVDDFEIRSEVSAISSLPAISNIQVSNITSSTATISWNTNTSNTAQVFYDQTSNYDQQSNLDSSYSTSHSMVLTGLTPETTYHFSVRAVDKAGNTSQSNDMIFTTPYVVLMQDNFNQGATHVDSSKWVRGSNNYNNAHISNNQLHFLVTDNRSESAWICTANTYTAKNTMVTIHIPQVNRDGELAISPTYTWNAKYGFYEEPDTYRFFTGDPGTGPYTLNVSHTQNGTLNTFNVTNGMDISSGVYLRMRFDNVRIYFEASLDGISWQTMYEETFYLPGFTLDSQFYYSLSAYKTWGNGQGNGIMIMDDFEIRQF